MVKRAAMALLLIVVSPGLVFSAEDGELYRRGYDAARREQIDFAFMYFSMLVREFPQSKFADDALFATGEYYFMRGGHRDARRAFRAFLKKSEEPKTKLFALVYLMKIAAYSGKKDLTSFYEKEIVTFKQFSFLFRESKEITYVSVLSRKYKAVYFIDEVEIYVDEQLFAQIPF